MRSIYEWKNVNFQYLIIAVCFYRRIHSHLYGGFVVMQFLDIGPELCNNYNEVISQQDVAIYGGLCALATFERRELEANFCFSLFNNYCLFSIYCYLYHIIKRYFYHNNFLIHQFYRTKLLIMSNFGISWNWSQKLGNSSLTFIHGMLDHYNIFFGSSIES